MSNRIVRRLFESAWPTSSIDCLLRAAILVDEKAAAAAWRDFETTADFDHLTAGEMRLIGLAAKRLERLAPRGPMRARIGGIERANWVRSQLAIHEASGGMRCLASAGIRMLLIKGVARSALGGPAAVGRIVNDVDVVVRPEAIEGAFETLTREGWEPAGSGTVSYHRAHIAEATGMNLVRGQFGNLDLHRTPFHPPYASLAKDGAIWERATVATIAGVTVAVPSPTDFATIAIAHGCLDAHKSSDWLADVADCVDRGIDWDLLDTIVRWRRLEAPAAIMLSYVRTRLGRPVPDALVSRLQASALRRPLALLGALAEARPKARTLNFFSLARAVAKQSRLLHRHWRRPTRLPVILPSLFSGSGVLAAGSRVVEQRLDLPERGADRAWAGLIDLTLSVALPAITRRVDFEIVAGDRHKLRLRAVVLNRGPRQRLLRFKFPLALTPDDGEPVLAATASRRFNTGASADKIERYQALPFALVRFRAMTTPGAGKSRKGSA